MEKHQIKFLSLEDMWGIKGRLGRLHYALIHVRIVVMALAIFTLLPLLVQLVSALGVTPKLAAAVFVNLVLICMAISNISIMMRRVQDIGYPYWVILIMILFAMLTPLENGMMTQIAIAVILCIQMCLLLIPGEIGENTYGTPVENTEQASSYRWMKPATQGIAVFGMVFIIAGCFIVLFKDHIPEEYLPENMDMETTYRTPKL